MLYGRLNLIYLMHLNEEFFSSVVVIIFDNFNLFQLYF